MPLQETQEATTSTEFSEWLYFLDQEETKQNPIQWLLAQVSYRIWRVEGLLTAWVGGPKEEERKLESFLPIFTRVPIDDDSDEAPDPTVATLNPSWSAPPSKQAMSDEERKREATIKSKKFWAAALKIDIPLPP